MHLKGLPFGAWAGLRHLSAIYTTMASDFADTCVSPGEESGEWREKQKKN
jgi:hypothetical protein